MPLAWLVLAALQIMPPAPGSAMFRGGPEHTGVYAAASGPALGGLAWRVATMGDVVSSPAVLDGVLFIGSGDGQLYALDLASGVERWHFNAASPIASSPAVGDGRVYFGTRSGEYLAIDARTGAPRWRFRTGAEVAWPWGHESGDLYYSSPAYIAGTVVFGAGDGRVYALNAATGKERWHAATEGRVRSSPAVAGGKVYVGSADGRVYCFDLGTGARVWRFDTQGAALASGNFGFDRRTVQSSPAVAAGTVFVGARDGFLYALSADSGRVRWRFDHQISWVNSSPAVSDGVVYAGSSDGHFLQAVDAATGRELWRLAIPFTVWSSPAVAGDIVYFGDGGGRLNAAERRSGRLLWSFRTASGVFSSPVVAGGLVVFGSTDGGIYALRPAAGPEVRRAVFLDTTYRAVAQPDAERMSAFFAERGYQVLDAAGLTAFLEAGLGGGRSVVVFATDYLPPAVAAPNQRSLLRRYLDAGGKVVWTGIPPLLWPVDSTGRRGGLGTVNWAGPNQLLGVDHGAAIFDRRGVRPTAAGARRGLPSRWRDAWSVDTRGVSEVLGLDEWGLAASWEQRYGGPPGTGFIRVPREDLHAVYLAAEHRP